jgi:dephospho-CoA kinase
MTTFTVGLTGGIGSGKTTVAFLFEQLNIKIIDTDVIARDITAPQTEAFTKILEHFGKSILAKDGTINRSLLRDIIFKNPEERKWLEKLLHPFILVEAKQQIDKVTTPYCMVIIPLLFETGPHTYLDRILVVDTTEETQIERTKLRDQTSSESVRNIINTQFAREKRLAGADDIILNSGEMKDLLPQVKKLHQLYLSLAQEK